MHIVDVVESTRPISSNIRNAFIDFSKMTLSLVAVVTDVVRDGKPVIGYGFNSNGRYGQGSLIRERFRPRVLDADPASLLDDSGENLDPHKIWACMMHNEKPGGHGERSVAVGTIDMAVWDAVAKIAGQPLHDLLARRYGNGKADPRVFVYAAGGYYHPGKGLDGLRGEMASYLERGYSVVKMKIGGAPLAQDMERIETVLAMLQPGQQLAVDANGRFDLPTALAYGKAMADYPLFWYEEAGDPLDCTLSYGLVEYLRTLDMLKDYGWSPRRCVPHGGHQMSLAIAAGLGLGGNESYPDLFQPYGGFPDGVRVENGYVTLPPLPGIGFEGKADLFAEMLALTR